MTEPLGDDRREALWQALRRHVCSVCLDRKDDGTCGLSGDRTCGLDAHLARIVDVVASVHSPRMDEYVQAIRERVCTQCEQDAEGACRVRDTGECALDAYLPLVVEAIEEVEQVAGGES